MTDKPYQRHHTAVCNGKPLTGNLMYRLTRFVATSHVSFKDDFGIDRQGVAWTWGQWAEELGITRDTFRRAVLEPAIDEGYVVRAQRGYGPEGLRVNRMHLAVSELYMEKLARCVALGPKAYLAEIQIIKSRRAKEIANGTLATMAKGASATVAKGTLAKVAKVIENSEEDRRNPEETAMPADAGMRILPKNSVLGEERSLRSLPTSPSSAAPLHARGVQFTGYEAAYSLGAITTRSPDLARKLGVPATVADDDADEKPVVGPTEDLRDPTPTVTGDGLARKLHLLGVLEDWKSVCKSNGVRAATDITDDQLEELDQRCREQTCPFTGCIEARPSAMWKLLTNAVARSGSDSLPADYVYPIIDAGTYPDLVDDITALLL